MRKIDLIFDSNLNIKRSDSIQIHKRMIYTLLYMGVTKGDSGSHSPSLTVKKEKIKKKFLGDTQKNLNA